MENCLGEKIKDVISVCDREADVYEYIQYKLEHKQRFIVRGKHNRKRTNPSVKLLEDLSNLKPIGNYATEIAQKSKRKKRVVELEIMGKQVTFMPAERSSKALAVNLRPITLNVVIARETNPLDSKEILEWILLTSEPIRSFEEIRQITRYYELRWRIGVSRIRTLHLVGESPTEVKDSSLVAREASWRESKTMEPSDNIFRKEYAQCTRL